MTASAPTTYDRPFALEGDAAPAFVQAIRADYRDRVASLEAQFGRALTESEEAEFSDVCWTVYAQSWIPWDQINGTAPVA